MSYDNDQIFNDGAEEKDAYTRANLIHENVLTTFSSPQGEFVLAWLYDLVRMGRTSFIAGQSDQTAFNEGRRSVLLEIQGQMRLDDEELFRRARRVTQQLENRK